MMHSDMAIIRDLEADGIQHIRSDGRVDCTIKDQITQVSRCPAAATLAQAGVYRDNNAVWLSDFRRVLTTMLQKGLK